ncbi:3-oxoacyl-ACP reductase [Prauserella marina]|uniref:3-oxoacyl-[acyl-carrier protein] reductase n=1 Tax=Prauserella marina TaxID=530584 RepID=A0A222VPW8_9PSEU|nr:SDR family oxidoreductase [Prauserella marina]ASR35969.1 3-oxoacyl-ACP reductase [Prauserella marina]PWV84092.1 3-oxoacyl-[acyl-carrier protein] reductase [Prauserella marina]SDC30521.1 3-oxoacyl-[acyl-carrier protein] reductase [Prauserella marina]
MSARAAVVTGAARGLGRAIAGRLHELGYLVALTDLDADAAVAEAAVLDAGGGTAVGLGLDVRDKASFENVRDELVGRWGAVHVLVNNAGRSIAEPLLEISQESFSSVVSTNLDGTFLGSQVFGAHFADNGFGRIINMASLAGQNGGTATGGHYAAAKGGVATLTKVFARELAASGVTVNAVSPGPQDLPVVREMLPAERLEEITKSIPVGRLGSPAFIADMVALLAADHASSVTGACWDANGGLYLR